MQLTIGIPNLDSDPQVARLLRRTLSPLCGLDQAITALLRVSFGPRFTICGAELTGAHVIAGQPAPQGVAPYHIGGTGYFLDEALIRSIGESVERYSQVVSERFMRESIRVLPFRDLASTGIRTLPESAFALFTAEQMSAPGFPFSAFHPDMPLGWVRCLSLSRDDEVWAPAQMILVGYSAKSNLGEQRIAPAVTTGTAAHTRPDAALRNCILELCQIDAAVGHWYSSAVASRIRLDDRTAAISRLVARCFPALYPVPEFYYLPSPDLPAHVTACIVRAPSGQVPASSVGLGSDLVLARSMYKALLEAVGVAGLSRYNLLDLAADTDRETWRPIDIDSRSLFDLDTNVAYYGLTEMAGALDGKFAPGDLVAAADLPPDVAYPGNDEIRHLVNSFTGTGKELLFLDLTAPDIRQLDFYSFRLWSPDTLSLPLPSAPPLAHPRMRAYGGGVPSMPHPYP